MADPTTFEDAMAILDKYGDLLQGVREFGESKIASSIPRYAIRSLQIMLRALAIDARGSGTPLSAARMSVRKLPLTPGP